MCVNSLAYLILCHRVEELVHSMRPDERSASGHPHGHPGAEGREKGVFVLTGFFVFSAAKVELILVFLLLQVNLAYVVSWI